MNRKKTQEEFEQELFKINPNIEVLGKYINIDTKILCRCKIDGYEWNPISYTLLKGVGCPRCSNLERYTQEVFIAKLNNINPNIQVLEKYLNSKTKILCKCKIDGYEWNPIPSSLLRGEGCPQCSQNSKYTQVSFEEKINSINSNIQILGKYINAKTKIHCRCKKDEYEWYPLPSDLLSGAGCPKCCNQIKYTQRTLIEKLKNICPNIIILGKYKNCVSKIHCKCKIDNYEWNPIVNNLLNGQGCPVCSNHNVLRGINDMWTTNPELAKLLADPEDGYKYTQGSSKRVNWKCPDCGNIIKNKIISQIYRECISCPRCSDGISYPEKFMYNLLQQLNIDFEYQKKFDWCKYKFKEKQKYGIYDFYIPSKQIIIEMDGGLGHGNKDTKQLTKEESKYIDCIKDELAQEYNIVKLIRINCDYGNIDSYSYIKNNVLKSELNNIFDLSKIDWNVVLKCSQDSFVCEICKYKNNHQNVSVSDLVKIYKLNKTTIVKYLKLGDVLNWCHYNPKEEMRKSGQQRMLPVICITTGKIYNSIKEAESDMKCCGISACCRHKIKYAGKLSDGTKLHWQYYNK